MMIENLNAVLHDAYGDPAKAHGDIDFTLKYAIIGALNAKYGSESNEIIYHNGKIALQLTESTENTIELMVEDIANIKSLIAQRWDPIIVAQAWNLIEGGT